MRTWMRSLRGKAALCQCTSHVRLMSEALNATVPEQLGTQRNRRSHRRAVQVAVADVALVYSASGICRWQSQVLQCIQGVLEQAGVHAAACMRLWAACLCWCIVHKERSMRTMRTGWPSTVWLTSCAECGASRPTCFLQVLVHVLAAAMSVELVTAMTCV